MIRDEFQVSADAVVVRRRVPRRKGQPQEYKFIRVDPDVWARVMVLAKGDTRRIQVVSAEEVFVHNNERWGRK